MTTQVNYVYYQNIEGKSELDRYGVVIKNENATYHCSEFENEMDLYRFVNSKQTKEEAFCELLDKFKYFTDEAKSMKEDIKEKDYLLNGESAKLPSEINDKEIDEMIEKKAKWYFIEKLGIAYRIATFFERNQWYVTIWLKKEFDDDDQTIKNYVVCDQEKDEWDFKNDAEYGFIFEEV